MKQHERKEKIESMLTFHVETIKRQSPSFPAVFLYSGKVHDLKILEISDNDESNTANHPERERNALLLGNYIASSAKPTCDLHISHDCLSPKLQKNDSMDAFSGFTVSILDENQSMLSCFQGISKHIVVDEISLMIVWGSSIAILYQDLQSLRNFLTGVKNLEIKHKRLTVPMETLSEEHEESSSFSFYPGNSISNAN